MNQNVLPSELSLLMVNAQLTRPDGSVLDLSDPEISGTNFTYPSQVNCFSDSDVGNYSCTATVRPQPFTIFLTGFGELSNTATITVGNCYYQEHMKGRSVQLPCTPGCHQSTNSSLCSFHIRKVCIYQGSL